MKQSTHDQAKGLGHEAKGAVKETAGRMTGKPDLEAEGTGEKVAGKIQKNVGKAEKTMEKRAGK